MMGCLRGFVFALRTLKPEAVTTLGKLRVCLNHSNVRTTIVTQSETASAAATAAADHNDDDNDDDDFDDKLYSVLKHHTNEMIKRYHTHPQNM